MPVANCQFLCNDVSDETMQRMVEHGFDLDVYYKSVTKELVDACHKNGMVVNCWTVNTTEDAERSLQTASISSPRIYLNKHQKPPEMQISGGFLYL